MKDVARRVVYVLQQLSVVYVAKFGRSFYLKDQSSGTAIRDDILSGWYMAETAEHGWGNEPPVRCHSSLNSHHQQRFCSLRLIFKCTVMWLHQVGRRNVHSPGSPVLQWLSAWPEKVGCLCMITWWSQVVWGQRWDLCQSEVQKTSLHASQGRRDQAR